ncbi:MAG: sugar-transfer associated ATP-grasp domain-containing protein [Cyanobacteriota bacterium]|nr:sugar-transfer associated ATP-grasp domain-containing protein [Cyanobacteriota bacterium]
MNSRQAHIATVLHLISGLDRYIATSFVEQTTYVGTIQPATANTLKVLALRYGKGVFIASVVHRFGTAASLPVDTVQGGRGLCAAVDLERERLKTAVNLDEQGRRRLHTHHPETGSQIEGRAIAPPTSWCLRPTPPLLANGRSRRVFERHELGRHRIA